MSDKTTLKRVTRFKNKNKIKNNNNLKSQTQNGLIRVQVLILLLTASTTKGSLHFIYMLIFRPE